VRRVACMKGEQRHVHILVVKHKGRGHLGNQGIDGRILKWI
jgi:hypothetical protein